MPWCGGGAVVDGFHIEFHIWSGAFEVLPIQAREFHGNWNMAVGAKSGNLDANSLDRMMHPQTNAKLVMRLDALGGQIMPINGVSVQRFELVHNWTSPTTNKRKQVPHLKGMTCACTSHVVWRLVTVICLLSNVGKRRFPRLTKENNEAQYCGQLFNQRQLTGWKAKEGEARYGGQLFNTSIDGWNSEKGRLFHFT